MFSRILGKVTFIKKHIVWCNNLWIIVLLTMTGAVAIGVIVLNPLWNRLAVPGLFPSSIQPPITAPVDGLYYIRNAEFGYQWDSLSPLSLWFHPLVSFLVGLFPDSFAKNVAFWLLSISFAAASLPLVCRFMEVLAGGRLTSFRLLPFTLLAPGGLGMATRNAEIPALFFSLVLLLSVLRWHSWKWTVVAGTLAILTKPNSLYLVPMLLVYVATGIFRRNSQLWRQALLGVCAILIAWLVWAWFVEWKTGYEGAYWKVRMMEQYYHGTGSIWTFFNNLNQAFLNEPNFRDQVRYASALLIPAMGMIMAGLIPLNDESHRYAIAAGYISMLLISLLLGNPNKILVYSTTLPGHFSVHLLLLRTLQKGEIGTRRLNTYVGMGYTLYCVAMLSLFVLGTPLRWYF